ncbi:hypothetical protein [Phaffia rhodozyma]|uniref:Uncharacterized protein n=1 Tax=Phaffia rhodozyma TaxID=264483 RepID=A0A0F7SLE1_PHARH|nr:hypothetical protein [Phaffia rhodozyma]
MSDRSSTPTQPESLEVHTTTLDPVVQEKIEKHKHVITSTEVDKETHKVSTEKVINPTRSSPRALLIRTEHRIQPVQETVHLPEQHVLNVQPSIQKEEINPLSKSKAKQLEKQHHQIPPSRRTAEVVRTEQTLIPVEYEHVHHHIKEHITPVLFKQTHRHRVIHNVTPLRQTVWEEPIVYRTAVLPTLSLLEFEAMIGQQVPGQDQAREQAAGWKAKSSVDELYRTEKGNAAKS